MSIIKKVLGRVPGGAEYEQYLLTDDATGEFVSVLNLGCILQQIQVRDAGGRLVDVAVGYDTVGEYAATRSFFGAVLGRYANRIGGGLFSIDGTEYQTTKNERGNTLHGGASGFHNKLFDAEVQGEELVLRRVSADGEEGFPGCLTLTERVSFRAGRLDLRYEAVCDKATVVNISNHSVFNLDGQGNGNVLEQTLCLAASRVCAVDSALIPTGRLLDVRGTGFDFTTPKPIGKDIHAADPMIAAAHGYDVCYAVDSWDGRLKKIAEAASAKTGIHLTAYTDLPAVQLYTGMLLGKLPIFTNGKQGSRYVEYGGFCLETQHFPNAMNLPDIGDNVVLRPGGKMRCETVYEFSAS